MDEVSFELERKLESLSVGDPHFLRLVRRKGPCCFKRNTNLSHFSSHSLRCAKMRWISAMSSLVAYGVVRRLGDGLLGMIAEAPILPQQKATLEDL